MIDQLKENGCGCSSGLDLTGRINHICLGHMGTFTWQLWVDEVTICQ